MIVRLSVLCAAALVGGLNLVAVSAAHAACHTIPSSERTFRANLGSINKPFAMPGDFVEIRVRPNVCDEESSGLLPTAAQHVVTFVFKPPQGPADKNNVAIVTTDCAAAEADRQACEIQADVGRADCFEVNGGNPTGLALIIKNAEPRLQVRLPNTDSKFGPVDGRTFAGPTAIAVSAAGDPLPCSLASSPCNAVGGLIACIDELFPLDGTCRTNVNVASPIFPSFTALPLPNDYRSVCVEPVGTCTGTQNEVRLTTDSAGNLLIPMSWRGILVQQGGVPVPRLLRGSSSFEAFTGGGMPIVIPGNGFLDSYTPEGALLPPIFDPQSDPGSANEATIFGSADAPLTVLRVQRRSSIFSECNAGAAANVGLPCLDDGDCGGTPAACVPTTCVGGSNAGAACANDLDCTGGGECGPALFELRDRYNSDVGPVLIPRAAVIMGVCQDDGARTSDIRPYAAFLS